MILSEMLKLYFRVNDIPLHIAAVEIGVSTATLSRIQNGKTCDMRSFARLIAWLIGDDSRPVAAAEEGDA